MPTETAIRRVESFPFDSKADGYDADGYPVYDRAVGAYILRSTFAKFFSDGIFPSPATGLQLGAGASGLTVTVQPGIFIIKGAMGGFELDADPVTLTLDTQPPQGNTCYGVMMHYDENDTETTGRSLSLRVMRGEAASSPVPPEPDRTTPGIYEYRIGYVQLASGATSVTASDVHNEKGTDVCPFAAPFEELDMDAVILDAKAQAEESLTVFSEQLQTYYDLVQSAVDGTTAGNLQNQIDELKGGTFSENNVDGETIIYSPTGTSGGVNKLQVKDLGIGTEHLKDKSVTQAKLGDDVVSYIQKPQPGKDILAYSWQELIEMANDPDIELSDLDYLIGQSRDIQITGYGTFAFQLIGIGHDSLASGGTSKLLTFQSVDIVCNHNMNSSDTSSGGWASSAMRTFMNGDLLSKFPQYVKDVIVEVKKPYCATANGATQYSNDKLFIASEKEVFGTSSYGNDGTQYEYWSINNTNNARIKKLNGSAQYWWMRSVRDSNSFRFVGTDGSASGGYASGGQSYRPGCVPCFCIGQSAK